MANRAKIMNIVVEYKQDGIEKSKKIQLVNADGSMKYAALFWDGDCIERVLAPYYEKNKVPLRPKLMSRLEAHIKPEDMSDHIRPEDVMLLWDSEDDGKLPLMMAKELASPVDPIM